MLEYIQIFADMEAMFEPYDDAQRGRLVMAMMAYAYRGEEPKFDGVEKFLWPVLKQHIDRCAASVEAKKAAGSKGGKRKAEESETKQTETDASTSKQTQAQASTSKQNAHNHDHDNDHDQDNDHEEVVDARTREAASAAASETVTAFNGEDLSEQIRINAEVDALMRRYRLPEYNREAIMDEISKHGMEKFVRVLKAAAESDNRGGLSIQFIRKCLESDGKPKPVRASPTSMDQKQNLMQRYTPEERKATYSAAVLDFDEEVS